VNSDNGAEGAGKNDVPQFQTLMLPLLKVMGGGHEMTTIQMRDAVADNLAMSPEALSQHLPTGAQNAFDNRMGWAITFLFAAGLLERPRRESYVISEIGKQVLLDHPVEIDAEFLRSYGDFNKFYDSPRGEYETLFPADGTETRLVKEGEIEISPLQIHRQLRDKIIAKFLELYHKHSSD
jgi:restriction system protein